ncbi:hypothetical protein [Lysinibacillus sp. Bpr_S20]|uniref:hypothetical protein n=1 Tax=Lysinibacillus sp. Bpr_S20 TaxID=2933964 RepID=UPI0020121CFD|nr:hypothetical protein [Lysinibacillus sp. Bpr_S20]MCL1700762.1 hypothetical protein [Lysinibacillus sp. Bpr_S20]
MINKIEELIHDYKINGVKLENYNPEGTEALLFSIIRNEILKKVIEDLETIVNEV